APVRPDGTATLIDLMEGVEDIPGSALVDGMPWGSWESFADYLDVLAGRRYAVDIAAQLAHGALRYYVMGDRGVANEDATADDIAEMARLTREAFAAGAVGFSTSRTIGHRSKSGTPVPGTFAAVDELVGIAEAMGSVGHGVFEAIVASTIGRLDGLGGERASMSEEFELLRAVQAASGRPVTFTVAQLFEDPDGWRRMLDTSAAANAAVGSLAFRPQIIPRSVTVMTSLDTYHMFMLRPTYQKLAHLGLAERAAEMHKPEVKAAILTETDDPAGGLARGLAMLFTNALPVTFPLTEPVNYEPSLDRSVLAQAMARGLDVAELMYDLLTANGGNDFYMVLGSNFVGGNLDVCKDMLLDPNTVTGLSDAGAHVNLISDCSSTTFHLTHWARDRVDGLPVETVVAKMTANNADLYGFNDRGRLVEGLRADINVVDLDRLTIHAPFVRYDLPSGASRILQPSTGYVATLVNGVAVRRNDADTGERPGRLARGGPTA
ncbi:MAG TPA: amidohydrolase family protein, partial [Ilumatobacteraceae bacterium]|nr:amidohydrolase family protein [Ilumatobacteraceae bacterium]